MEKFNWNKTVGYGALVWAIMFALVSLLAGYALYDTLISKIIVVLAAGVLSYLFAVNTKPGNMFQAFGYGAAWVIVGVVLDVLITIQFNTALFSSWEYWLSDALILFAPALYTGLNETGDVKISHA